MPATYEPIATTTLGSAAASITFSSIPSTYTDLRLVLVGRNNSGAASWRLEYNASAGTAYSNTFVGGDGTNTESGLNTNLGYFQISAISSPTTSVCMATVDIFSYAGSTNKTALASFSNDRNGAGGVATNVGLWRSTSAITSIKWYAANSENFAAGTTATLYGIKNA
jgi:hypothetical protein